MIQATLYAKTGKEKKEISLAEEIFGAPVNRRLLALVEKGYSANQRRGTASTKTRGDVRGGGKKPWKQKGTGRARQGSIRSPQWVGGGITFGPSSERNYALKINRKTKQKALFMALSDKLNDKQLLVLESIAIEPTKTKVLVSVMKSLPVGKTTLLVAPGSQPNLMRMTRNVPHVKLVNANSVNLVDVLGHRSVVFLKDAVGAFEKLYA